MQARKQAKLEAKGWKVGDASEFLELTAEETAYIETKFALSDALKQLRQKRRLTQGSVAKLVGSSQSRIAKMEVGDASVSLDLLIRTLLALGASRKDIARMIASRPRAAA